MPRKYALHLVLAGNRYARAAQVSVCVCMHVCSDMCKCSDNCTIDQFPLLPVQLTPSPSNTPSPVFPSAYTVCVLISKPWRCTKAKAGLWQRTMCTSVWLSIPFSIHNLSFAKAAFHNLLSHESVQSPTLQRLHLQDYVYVCKVRGHQNHMHIKS